MHFKPWLVYLVIGFLGLVPLLMALLAGAVANWAKCELSEASVGPCVIGGRDVGKVLYTMFVSGWFSLITLPAALLAMMIYSVYLLVRR
ncbi:hypothetical protein [Dyella choica]|uniref:Uncharacterized protein n=1 Tax=Dyella choica TaxID=1927959 RepID=A0A3S0S1M3_9GAMM|nr:hypothetical protein [Dyella choica]RUL77710.1 hypothetical protein EKH80_07520 [Dyella choica]